MRTVRRRVERTTAASGAPAVRGPGRGVRLSERLATLYPEASGRARKRWLAMGRVRVNGQVVRRSDASVEPGDRVELGAPPPRPFPAPLRLVHEDTEVLVVDKPSGLLTIATEREREHTAYRMLADYVADQRPVAARLFVVHRLDRETSGLLVFAKSPAAKRFLQSQFAARTVERGYVAVVEGRMDQDAGTLRTRLREGASLRVRPTRRPGAGREAITHYRVLARGPAATLLDLRLETGRRGQIRAQLAAIDHPISGDHAHGSRRDPLRRLGLHASRLGFNHPRGPSMRFESPVPPAFRRAL